LEKSPDAFRTISEAAEELDVPQHVLRFWETRFAQIKPMKRAGGRRYYRPGDVELLKGIRSLLYKDGYTIKGLQRILKEEGIAYVTGIGRGEIVARKRELELDGAPQPGKAQFAPRIVKPGPRPSGIAVAKPASAIGEAPVIVHKLSDIQADNLKAALRELGEARKSLDPSARV
jgi:DNA-binding transcriptional MerR regulator